jgi:acyl transferase domain-containing protein/acyl-CoA synthetase (AMP-forming)/AMP-acid ligase II/NADPH:quinone reductase-like Zn-dependent oxidoreductase/NAD(P)-dependent dehydrogenase (short-subunit alcohol dehydrogenase family)/acyl carrier protein
MKMESDYKRTPVDPRMPQPDLEYGPSLVHILRRRAATNPNGLYFRFLHTGEIDGPSVEVTWAQFERDVRRIAARLQRVGARGERVLLLYPPGPEFIAAFMACLYAGAVAVPAFPPDPSRLSRTLPRLRAIAEDAESRFALAPAAICRMGASLSVAGLSGIEWIASDNLAAGLEDEWELPGIAGEGLAFLQYTSGSTGTPRGVMVTHGNLIHNSSLIQRCYGNRPDMHGAIWLPVYHDMGLIGGLLQPIYCGMSATFMSPLDFLRRPIRWLEAITRTRAAISGGPDFAYRLCLRKVRDEELKRLDLSSWTVAFSGAEPVRPATLDAFADRFAACGFDRRALYPTYGLAEGTLMISGALDGPRAPIYFDLDAGALELGRVRAAGVGRRQTLVSCGPVDPALELAIVDPNTATRRAADEVGEIWLRGPSVAAGYWGDREGTRARFAARLIGDAGPGFLRTGDLGFCHAGELYVTGRLKDLIIVRGRNIHPQDLEELAQQAHSRVRPGCVAAFGVELDDEERIVLVAEIDERGGFAAEDICERIRRRVAEEAGVELHAIALLARGDIPKTSSGKVQRHACKAAWLDGTLATVARTQSRASTSDTAPLGEAPRELDGAIAAIRTLVAEELGQAPASIPVDEPLHALGLDSLRLVELTARIEELFGRALATLTLFSYPTIAALAGFLTRDEHDGKPLTASSSDAVVGAGPYVRLAAACADIERRSTRYQFDLERDVAWDRIDEPGLHLPDSLLRDFGFDVDSLRRAPAAFELLQWAMAMQVCTVFELFEFGVIYFAREEAERLGRTRSVELLALEEDKHVQLFRRYARRLRAQRPELAEQLTELARPDVEAIHGVMQGDEHGGIAGNHYACWLAFLFFEEYTVLFDKRLREAEGIQPTWRSAHVAHRREEIQHIATDVRYLRAVAVDDAERWRISAALARRLIEDFDHQFGIAGARRLVEAHHPGVSVLADRPHRAVHCLQRLFGDRTFAHSWKAGPFFRELTRLPAEQVLAAAIRATAPRGSEIERIAGQAEPIAIVGIGCRFPGSANSADALWELLLAGVDAITEIPRDRWDVDAWFDPDPTTPGKMYTRWGGFVDHIREFDFAFFGITPKEARNMDPQQRMLLEVSWQALEHASIVPSSLRGSPTGVFVGICSHDFSHRTLTEPIDAYSGTGVAFSVAAGRISYVLGATGPCVAVDTACSSSLVAVHQACRALENGEASLALAAGVNAILVPKSHVFFSALRAMSPVGRCKSFDAEADGYVRSEGCGVVVLERLADARRNGHRVLAVIRGTAVNQDGRSNGLTAPNGLAQEAVMRTALARAGLMPDDVDYVEAHGTGTALGDPIELQAIGAVHRGRRDVVHVGSLKTQIGHSEGAAGIAGLIKATLIAERGLIPPNIHFHRPTPQVPWAELPIAVVTEPRPLGGRRGISVNSFGFGGTNAHAVLEPARPLPLGENAIERPLHPILVSGHTPQSLRENADRLARALVNFADEDLADVAHTLACGREHQALRAGLFASDIASARAGLAELAAATPEPAPREAPRVAFVFTGQGAQYCGMGRGLYETQPVYRAVIDELATYFDPLLERPLHAILFDEHVAIDETGLAQPALFCVELALASLWRAWGIVPELVLGHSIGEIAAACFVGMISMADAAELVAARGGLMQGLPRTGAMIAITADEATIRAAIASFEGSLSIAAINGPNQIVISGDEAAALEVAGRLAASGVETRRLDVSHAFHSEAMRPMLSEFALVVERLRFEAPELPLLSTVDPSLQPDALRQRGYWVEHVMATVRFADALQAARERGIDTFVEIGPRPTLLGLAAKQLDESVARLPSLWPPRSDWEVLGESVLRLHRRGATIDWTRFDAPYVRRWLTLPSYAFARVSAWSEEAPSLAIGQASAHPLLGMRLDVAGRETFETTFGPSTTGYLNDHRVVERVVVPATMFFELLRAAAGELGNGSELTLHNVEIRRALLLDDDERRRVQVVAELREDRLELEVHCREAGADARWQLHARAHAKALVEAPAVPELDASEFTEVVEPDGIYTTLAAVGLEYGPRFRGLRSIRRSERGVLVELALPDGVQEWSTGLHPVVLDAALQAAAALGVDGAPTLLLPVGVERYRWFGDARGSAQLLARVTRSAAGIDVVLWDHDGRAIAELSGLQLREADPALFRVRRRQEQASAFALRWVDAQPRVASRLGRWLIVGDDPLARAIADALGRRTEVVRIEPRAPIRPLAEFEGAMFVAPSSTDPAGLQPVLEPALRLAQAHARASGSLVFVTRGAIAVAPAEAAANSALAGSALWGLGRSIAQEVQRVRLIDLDPQAALDDAVASLLGELGDDPSDREDQLAYRDGRRLAARLVRAADTSLVLPENSSASWQLRQRERGVLDSLTIERAPRPKPGPGEVEITVEAAGLNFRDVLGALGMLPGPMRPLGGECAGRVTAVGEGVTHLEIGDPVMGMASCAFARHAITDARLMVRRPAGIDAIAGATIPAAFLTAWYGLYELAKLRVGEWCLIHAAAGGVGMAAVQLARRVGARVIATASPSKWHTVRELSVTEVFSSREPGWANDMRAVTGGAGVDVVLNSLTGAFIHDSFAALAEGGRFLEMGKAEIWDEAQVRAVHASARYQAFDLLTVDPDAIQHMLQAIAAALAAGEITPLPRRSFAIGEAVSAFRTMAQGRHVGKIVLTNRAEQAAAKLDPDGTWLVTGGFGGLGRHVVTWLCEHGVRRLALVARTEPDGERRTWVEELRGRGVEVQVVLADLADPDELETRVAELATSMSPLRGVVHAAGVLDDGVLGEQSWPRVEAVLAPKAGAAWAMHHATQALPLDAFVLFSSITGTLGGAGQAGYSSANAYLDALARHRHALGCAAVSIAWGPWADAGMAARLDARQQRRLAEQGLIPIEPEQGLQWFARALGSDAAHMIVAPIDLARLRRRLGNAPVPPLFAELLPATASDSSPSMKAELERLPATDRHARLLAILRERSARVMGAAGANAVDPHTPLRDLGLDSLMGVDLHTELSRAVGQRLEETMLLDHPTLDRLAAHLLGVMGLTPRENDAQIEQSKAELARELEALEVLL